MTPLVLALTTFALMSSAARPERVAGADNWTPLSFTIFNDCTGEDIQVSGAAHIVTRTWTEGNNVFIRVHTNYNLSGVGLVSGRGYRLHQNTNSMQVLDVTSGASASEQVHHLSMISGGRMPNVTVTMNGTILLDPSGNSVIVPRKWEATCK